jgi:uncharacterized heparinase superfamily protein
MNILRLFHTVKYLKPVQVGSRIWKKIHHPRIPLSPAPEPRKPAAHPSQWCRRTPSMPQENHFRFLNTEATLQEKEDWVSLSHDKLWMYNLHYFDDLTADNAKDRQQWHKHLIQRWIQECPPGTDIAWDPYPTSLRIVNWIKYLLEQQQPEQPIIDSLATQIRALRRNLEWHLLGNHLFANAKALIVAGLFFDGKEAAEWLQKGSRIMQDQLAEQILPDGGQFELSPMYQCILLEDILDLIQFNNLYPGIICSDLIDQLNDCAPRMLEWLSVMTRPNGEIVQFNDAAQGIAAKPEWLFEYAERLGIQWQNKVSAPFIHLSDTGYVRVQNKAFTLFADIGDIGPDYIPGHAHADSLNFELHLGDQPVIIDSGTSVYGISKERHRQRSTAAHNTVEVDGLSSSEVWGGFRVARRARTQVNQIKSKWPAIIDAQHDGYQTIAAKSLHRRIWSINYDSIEIQDSLPGKFNQAIARFHLHPEITVTQTDRNSFTLTTSSGKQLQLIFSSGEAQLSPSTYHPCFGINTANQCLEVQFVTNRLITQIVSQSPIFP